VHLVQLAVVIVDGIVIVIHMAMPVSSSRHGGVLGGILWLLIAVAVVGKEEEESPTVREE
jgi:mannose/fructose/N-acetylgalactosamine-specific phosphotransferase system component IID